MSGQRRRRLDAGTWREVLERFAAAGTTVDKFCECERVSTSSFYRWRERLGPSGMQPVVAHREQRSDGVSVPPLAAKFIDLGSLAGSSRSTGSALELRLDLGGGVVLQITRQ
jgi:hypothetical protein